MKKFLMLMMIMCVLGLSFAVFTAEKGAEEGPITIGMSFAEFYTERWSREMVIISELAAIDFSFGNKSPSSMISRI